MPSYPKNYPFYSWMPKPLGIIILLFFFLPILTVGGGSKHSRTDGPSGSGKAASLGRTGRMQTK